MLSQYLQKYNHDLSRLDGNGAVPQSDPGVVTVTLNELLAFILKVQHVKKNSLGNANLN